MTALAAAAVLVWLGMVIAISFIEAPLKFRAPGVTLPIGLGIGRLVFRALNIAEGVLAVTALTAAVTAPAGRGARVALGIAALLLLAQVAAVRPALARRSNRVLAGAEGPRSHAHLAYVALEIAKTAALITAGTLFLLSPH